MTEFHKLKEFDINSLKAENTNLRVLLSSLQSEKEMEIEVLKVQNKEYCDILKNIQEKANQHYIEIQRDWEKKYFALETQYKKKEIELEKAGDYINEIQKNYREIENSRNDESKQNKVTFEEIGKMELEMTKFQEKFLISEERNKELIAKNEILYNELQNYKKQYDASQLKLEQYLQEFQKNTTILENNLHKSNLNTESYQRQNELKQKQLEKLKTDFFQYKEKLEKMQENSKLEMNEVLKNYQESNQMLKNQNSENIKEIEKLNLIIFQLKKELVETKNYYGDLMGNLQENIRQNIKETLSNSKFSSPIPMRKEVNFSQNEKYSNSFSPITDNNDFRLKFIHKYN